MTQYDPSRNTGLAGGEPGDPETEEIRVEIEQTRTEMSGTIDAIQQRLAPDVLTEQAKDVARDAAEQAKTAAQAVIEQAVQDVKGAALEVTEHAVHEVKTAAREATVDAKDAAWDATVGRAEQAVSDAGETAKGIRSTVIDTVKQNPVPAALAGLSLFWLYRNRQTSQMPSGQWTQQAYGRTPNYQEPRGESVKPLRTGYTRPQDSWETSGSMPNQYGSGQYAAGPSGDYAGSDSGGIGDTMSRAASSAANSAGNMASSAGQMATGAGESVVDAGSSIVDIVKRNPIPAALVGLGLGWLYANRSEGSPDYRAHSGDHYRYDSSADRYGRSDSQESGPLDSAKGLASQGADMAGDLVGDVQDRVGDAASSVGEHASDLADAISDRTRRAPGQIQRMIEESPFMAAALAASIGGAVGLALPTTQPEDKLLGATRDRAMGRVRQAKNEAMDKVGEVAQEVKTTAEKEARTQGLTV